MITLNLFLSGYVRIKRFNKNGNSKSKSLALSLLFFIEVSLGFT
jgi:hypothetical protein